MKAAAALALSAISLAIAIIAIIAALTLISHAKEIGIYCEKDYCVIGKEDIEAIVKRLQQLEAIRGDCI